MGVRTIPLRSSVFIDARQEQEVFLTGIVRRVGQNGRILSINHDATCRYQNKQNVHSWPTASQAEVIVPGVSYRPISEADALIEVCLA